MLYHGSLLLIVVVGLVSCFPQPFGFPKIPTVSDLVKPSNLQIPVPEIPNVNGGLTWGIMDRFRALLRFLGLLQTPSISAKDILPLPGVTDVMGYQPSLTKVDVPGVPAVGGSPLELQDLNRRISRLEAVLKLEGRIQMVGDKMMATNGKEVDFAASSTTCNDVGGQIVTPINEEENNAVLEFVKKYNRYAYLGMRKGPIPGTFNDLNGVPAVYTNWRKGEPNGKGTEDCIEIYTDGQWNDKACNLKRLTVCEL